MNNLKKPKMIVFDLDYTLWPFWVDTHVTPPFQKCANGAIVDSHGQRIHHYPDVPDILEKLYHDGYTLGVASRTGEIKGARQLLDLFGWSKYFKHQEIYPGCKVKHFESLKQKSNIPISEMLFFDDENRNIHDLQNYGVVSILVRNGLTKQVVEAGLAEFAER